MHNKKSKPYPRDELDKAIDEEGLYHDLYSDPVGKHGKHVNGNFVGRQLVDAYRMGFFTDDEPDDSEYK